MSLNTWHSGFQSQGLVSVSVSVTMPSVYVPRTMVVKEASLKRRAV